METEEVSKPRAVVAPTPIGIFIRSQRDRDGLNQRELAEAIGCKRQSLDAWERGETVPTFPYLLKLAERWKTPIASVLELARVSKEKAT